jgi:hypothetical protein
MLKIETSLFIQDMVRLTKDGRSFMLMNTLMNQLKDNLIRSLDSMLNEISILFLSWLLTDTLTSSTTGIWSSRHQMEERLKSGTSISHP